MKYIIKTPGRTGSHIITSYLRNNNIDCKHCQELWIPNDPSNWIFINNKRRNWWNMACSRVITSYTKEYGPYTSRNIKVETDIESLIDSAGYAKNWYDTFDMQSKQFQWHKVVTIYYEDMLENINVLTAIGEWNTNLALTQKMSSPYTFKDTIVDYNKLKLQFLEWQYNIGLLDE